MKPMEIKHVVYTKQTAETVKLIEINYMFYYKVNEFNFFIG